MLSGGVGGSPDATEVRERAGERDVVDVVAGRVRERTVLAPSGHAPVDEARVAREARVGPEPEPLGHARAEPLDERVGLLDQAQHGLDAVGVLQVDGDVAPAARVEREPARPGARARRARPARPARPRRPCRTATCPRTVPARSRRARRSSPRAVVPRAFLHSTTTRDHDVARTMPPARARRDLPSRR